ncbi:MAG: hypothetical protein ACI9UR_002428 [Bacteroidia bacterium]
MISTRNIEIVNLGLIGISLGLAFLLPFRIFLFAYAVLGPLHYLTEINWLHGKSYFVKSRSWLPLSIGLVLIVALPKLFGFLGLTEYPVVAQVMNKMNLVSNGAIFIGIWTAFVWVFISKTHLRIAGFGLGLILAYSLNQVAGYVLLFGAMLPTVIHVYVFTGLFMLHGSLRSKSTYGYISVVGFVLVPFIIALVDLPHTFYDFAVPVKDTFLENGFHKVNVTLGKLLGITDGKTFFFYGAWELKVQTFLAFAYLYHYLNWFSKTTIIGWNKGLTRKKSAIILTLWITHVLLFYFDYRLGFISALTLSFLHVFAEFPLNAASFAEIRRQLWNRIS